jgi:PHD/YefM family antitoxin component YafN of YafNO toxin-antitoxin module
MDSLSLSEATLNLDSLINKISETNQPMIIKGTKNEVIVISQKNWSAIQETIYLNSIPGYIDSIKESIDSPREEWVNAKELGL